MLELYPESAEARLRIGEIYMMMDKNKEAIWQLEDAIQLDPLNVEVRRVRGTLFFLDGNYEKAAEDFKIAVKYANIEAKSKPIQELQEVQRVQELYYYLGLSCYHSGRLLEAIQAFDECGMISTQPDVLRIHAQALKVCLFICLIWFSFFSCNR